jgi:DNA primase
VIRFAELYHQVKFPQAVVLLRQWRGVEPVLQEAVRFYRTQLHRHSEAFVYLYERGIRSAALIEEMRIGYAPGGCLRGWLTQLGHSLPALCQTGLVTEAGYDAYVRRIVFPLEGNLYGRSLSDSAPAHRFLPGAKGGLYLWERVQSYPEVILVEGLFDYAAVWQAGFETSPARWEPISIRASFGNSATPRELSILHLTPTQTVVVSRRRNRWPAGSESKA